MAFFDSGQSRLHVTSLSPLERHDQDILSRFSVSAGDVTGFVVEWGAGDEPTSVGHGEILQLYIETEEFWRRWLEHCTYRGRWREAVERSAITLKLMTYAPSGALVAAPTAGLPEQIGGSRNWDYRFTWVRDGSFSVFALLAVGFTDDGADFGNWLGDRVEGKASQDS